jgi:hypothetical protein
VRHAAAVAQARGQRHGAVVQVGLGLALHLQVAPHDGLHHAHDLDVAARPHVHAVVDAALADERVAQLLHVVGGHEEDDARLVAVQAVHGLQQARVRQVALPLRLVHLLGVGVVPFPLVRARLRRHLPLVRKRRVHVLHDQDLGAGVGRQLVQDVRNVGVVDLGVVHVQHVHVHLVHVGQRADGAGLARARRPVQQDARLVRQVDALVQLLELEERVQGARERPVHVRVQVQRVQRARVHGHALPVALVVVVQLARRAHVIRHIAGLGGLEDVVDDAVHQCLDVVTGQHAALRDEADAKPAILASNHEQHHAVQPGHAALTIGCQVSAVVHPVPVRGLVACFSLCGLDGRPVHVAGIVRVVLDGLLVQHNLERVGAVRRRTGKPQIRWVSVVQCAVVS